MGDVVAFTSTARYCHQIGGAQLLLRARWVSQLVEDDNISFGNRVRRHVTFGWFQAGESSPEWE